MRWTHVGTSHQNYSVIHLTVVVQRYSRNGLLLRTHDKQSREKPVRDSVPSDAGSGSTFPRLLFRKYGVRKTNQHFACRSCRSKCYQKWHYVEPGVRGGGRTFGLLKTTFSGVCSSMVERSLVPVGAPVYRAPSSGEMTLIAAARLPISMTHTWTRLWSANWHVIINRTVKQQRQDRRRCWCGTWAGVWSSPGVLQCLYTGQAGGLTG